MNTLTKILSSFVGDHDDVAPPPVALTATPTATMTATTVAVDGGTPPRRLEDDDLHVEPVAPGTQPGGRRASRALRATAAVGTSVAVVPQAPMPTLPSPTQGFVGVVLNETERVRLRIMQAQIRLSSLMLYEGPIDGMLTVDTVTGIRWFQTLKGLRESGQLTVATLRALCVPALPGAPEAPPALHDEMYDAPGKSARGKRGSGEGAAR